MKVRTYALILLLVVAVLPLVVLGVVSIRRTEATARAQVRADTDLLARAIAGRIGAHIADQRKNLQIIGAAIIQAANPEDAENVYTLDDPYLHRLTVYSVDGHRVAGAADAAADNPDHAAVRNRALAGKSAAGPVRPPPPDASGPFANTITLGEPIVLAGEQKGAVVAQLDLVDIWQPINQVKVGRHGFVRLVGPDGALLAHGDPEERRYAFSAADNLALIEQARTGDTITNEQGNESYAAAAPVGQRDWTVVVEQPLDQALAGVHALKYSLLWLVAGTLVFVFAAALLAGRKAVGGVETLSAHTKVLARGDLTATLDARSGLAELDALAEAMNDMAASLARLNEEAKARERLTTFGRVAAGLTHDLRHPIEAMRNACEGLAHAPDDEHSWELFEWMRQNELPKLKRYLEDLRRLTIAGSMSLQRHEIEPADFLDELANELRVNPKWPGVEFEVDVQGGAAPLWADENLLRRAIYNLAANAADACTMGKQRGGSVRLVARNASAGAGSIGAAGNGTSQSTGIELRVIDTGPGMSPETLARVMGGDFHSTKRTNGIGLGLGVARHVAQMHGGRIEATSELGSGTTFTVSLPAAHPDEVDPLSEPH